MIDWAKNLQDEITRERPSKEDGWYSTIEICNACQGQSYSTVRHRLNRDAARGLLEKITVFCKNEKGHRTEQMFWREKK